MKLSNKWYAIFKWTSALVLPIIAIIVSAVFTIFDIPHLQTILEALSCIEGLVGSVIGISHKNYYNDLSKCDEDEEF